MIKVKRIKPQTIEVFDPKGKSLGYLNEEELLDLQIQIFNNRAKGYKLANGEPITEDGEIIHYPIKDRLVENLSKFSRMKFDRMRKEAKKK